MGIVVGCAPPTARRPVEAPINRGCEEDGMVVAARKHPLLLTWMRAARKNDTSDQQ
jgi:hypothetical protein